jgi:hypothetical protein
VAPARLVIEPWGGRACRTSLPSALAVAMPSSPISAAVWVKRKTIFCSSSQSRRRDDRQDDAERNSAHGPPLVPHGSTANAVSLPQAWDSVNPRFGSVRGIGRGEQPGSQLVGGGPRAGGGAQPEPRGGRASGAAQRRRLDLRTAQFGNAA